MRCRIQTLRKKDLLDTYARGMGNATSALALAVPTDRHM